MMNSNQQDFGLVSVVIPTHNRCDDLVRAIQSVTNQTYKNIEVIVVSDGSTDQTDQVMANYPDSRVSYIAYSPAKGGNHARNVGIQAAKGDFVAFLDDDDEWMESKVEKQVLALSESQDYGLAYTGVEFINTFNNKSYTYYSSPSVKGSISKQILVTNPIGTTSSVMIRRSLLEQECFDEEMPALQDYELWIRLCQITSITPVPEPLVKYYTSFKKNSSTQISNNVDKFLNAERQIATKHKNLINQLSPEELATRSFNSKMGLVNRYLRNNQGAKVRKICSPYILKKKSALAYYLLSFFPYQASVAVKSMKARPRKVK
ncbi:MAG: glycosyltransferase family 2 protein [Lachnospiraceae bacterium]|nr:glycosyltransferase family 2 protein [Candidatus Equihabitans merdae]